MFPLSFVSVLPALSTAFSASDKHFLSAKCKSVLPYTFWQFNVIACSSASLLYRQLSLPEVMRDWLCGSF
jgi:hypothetical protein